MKLFTDISELGRSTQVVDAESWHAKLYAYWYAHGTIKKVGYRENLCHYCRVVAIWAPLVWFFDGKLFGRRINPFRAFLVSAYLTLVGAPIASSVQAHTAVLIFLASVLLVATVTVIEKVYPGQISLKLKNIGQIIQPAFNWFFSKRLFGIVRPYMISLAAVVGWVCLIDPRFLIIVAFLVLFLLSCVGAAYLSHRHELKMKLQRERKRHLEEAQEESRKIKYYLALDELKKRHDLGDIDIEVYLAEYKRLYHMLYPRMRIDVVATSKLKTARKPTALGEMFRLGVRLMAAKKHKICPFIVIEDQNRELMSAK